MHAPHLLAVVERLVRSFDDRGITWCVLRNHGSFPAPRSDTSDLDILVGSSLEVAIDLLSAASSMCGASVGRVFRKSDGTLIGTYLIAPGYPALHVDLFSEIAWLGMPIVDSRVVLAASSARGAARVPRPGHEAAISLLGYLMHQGTAKEAYRHDIELALHTERDDFIACLAPVWGEAVSAELAARAAAGEWSWFEHWVPTAKRALLRGGLRRPMRSARCLGRIVVTMLTRACNPPGLWVAFLGPDGAGKTTLATQYRARLATLYYPQRQRHFHWRPRLLPSPGALAGRPESVEAACEPHGHPPHSVLLSALRLLYFWADYLLGHLLIVRPLVAWGGLATFDRYFDDFLVDQRRYRLALPEWVVRGLGRLVPRPDLVFVLDAPVQVLYSRKQELAPEEIESQLRTLRTIAAYDPAARLVRVDRTPAEIVAELEDLTVRFLDARERQRLGWPACVPTLHSVRSP